MCAYDVNCATQLFNKLMISLGYSEYVTQGGDWGHVVRTPLNYRQHLSDDGSIPDNDQHGFQIRS